MAKAGQSSVGTEAETEKADKSSLVALRAEINQGTKHAFAGVVRSMKFALVHVKKKSSSEALG
jgi:hypothetical protein